jgi:hypothetical protein
MGGDGMWSNDNDNNGYGAFSSGFAGGTHATMRGGPSHSRRGGDDVEVDVLGRGSH